MDSSNNALDLSQVVNAVVNTIAHPNLPSLLNDINLVVNLVRDIKAGVIHPDAVSVLKSLL